MRIPLGAEVGLGSGDIVLDGDPVSLPKKGAEAPIFGPCLMWANSWMDQDGTWHGGGPRSRPHCARAGSIWIFQIQFDSVFNLKYSVLVFSVSVCAHHHNARVS